MTHRVEARRDDLKGVCGISRNSSSDGSVRVPKKGEGGTICITGIPSDISVDVSEGGGVTKRTVGLSSKVTPERRQEF